MKKMSLLLFAVMFVCCLTLVVNAQAAIIADQTDSTVSSILANDPIVLTWTQPQAYSNVAISAAISSTDNGNGNPGAGTMWLTNQVGPGTTAANVLQSANFTGIPLTSSVPVFTSIFSGLTLPASTYYLVLSPFNNSPGLGWDVGSPTTSTITGLGVTVGYLAGLGSDPFPPASSGLFPFNLIESSPILYTITGDPVSSVPEPSTMLLLSSGVVGLAVYRKKCKA